MKDAKDKDGHSIKLLGRAGLIYWDKEEKYFIDSEMLIGSKFDIVVYSNSIRFYDRADNRLLPESKKKEIISVVIKLLLSAKIKADIQH
ncbi:MAG TPA: hypothetical protein VE035_17490 [Puia sp.]|nr:hypothetical protein [Puia sp.]